jgi:hypothetical protein
LKGDAVVTVTDNAGKHIYEQKLKPGTGIGKIFWNTARTEPGTYTVTLTCGTLSESTAGTILERWMWPVLNYNGDWAFGISER